MSTIVVDNETGKVCQVTCTPTSRSLSTRPTMRAMGCFHERAREFYRWGFLRPEHIDMSIDGDTVRGVVLCSELRTGVRPRSHRSTSIQSPRTSEWLRPKESQESVRTQNRDIVSIDIQKEDSICAQTVTVAMKW